MNKIQLPNDAALALIKAELLSSKSVQIPVKGTSMRPFFRDGLTLVTVAGISKPLKKFDVVLYEPTPGKMVLHRIIRIQANNYLIRGDGLITKELIPAEQLVAVVTSFETQGKITPSTNAWYRFKVSVWNFLAFLRRPLLGVLRRLGR